MGDIVLQVGATVRPMVIEKFDLRSLRRKRDKIEAAGSILVDCKRTVFFLGTVAALMLHFEDDVLFEDVEHLVQCYKKAGRPTIVAITQIGLQVIVYCYKIGARSASSRQLNSSTRSNRRRPKAELGILPKALSALIS